MSASICSLNSTSSSNSTMTSSSPSSSSTVAIKKIEQFRDKLPFKLATTNKDASWPAPIENIPDLADYGILSVQEDLGRMAGGKLSHNIAQRMIRMVEDAAQYRHMCMEGRYLQKWDRHTLHGSIVYKLTQKYTKQPDIVTLLNKDPTPKDVYPPRSWDLMKEAVLLFDNGWSIPTIANALLLSEHAISQHINKNTENPKS